MTKKQQKIYLMAKPGIASDFYTRGLGFSQRAVILIKRIQMKYTKIPRKN